MTTGHPEPLPWAPRPVQPESAPPADGTSAIPDTAWAIFQEACPQMDGLLPEKTLLEYANQAVKDLTGSISIEVLPEMAFRLASFRVHSHLALADHRSDLHQLMPHDADAIQLGERVTLSPVTVPAGATH